MKNNVTIQRSFSVPFLQSLDVDHQRVEFMIFFNNKTFFMRNLEINKRKFSVYGLHLSKRELHLPSRRQRLLLIKILI